MDRHDTDTLVQTGPPRPDSPRVVERSFVEDSMALWEEALSTELPEPDTGENETLFLGPEEPVTAPLAEDQSVEPERTEARDGFVPRPEEALRTALEEQAKSVLLAGVSVELPERKAGRPARRVFWFGRPVDSGDSPAGTLYALGPDGGLVELEGSVRATRVVEVIEEGPTKPNTETLTAEVQGGVAQWSRQDN
jgi:hypothetical protein